MSFANEKLNHGNRNGDLPDEEIQRDVLAEMNSLIREEDSYRNHYRAKEAMQ